MIAGLGDVKSVEVFEESKVVERWGRFIVELEMLPNLGKKFLGDRFLRTRESKVIDLMKEEDFVTLVGGMVNCFVMSGGLEVEIGGA